MFCISLPTQNYPQAYCCYISGRPGISKVRKEDMDIGRFGDKALTTKAKEVSWSQTSFILESKEKLMIE